jgi:hypothetical protein
VEKTPDLKHREKGFVFSNDDVLDRSDFLVLVVDDAAADQLARAIALGDLMHVNDDELDFLRQYGHRERGNQHRRRAQPHNENSRAEL